VGLTTLGWFLHWPHQQLNKGANVATRISLRRRALEPVFCIALLTASSAAFALAGGSRQPINPVGGEQLWSPSNTPVLSVNTERSVVVGTEGHQTVTSFTVDQTAGTIRGYAGYRLDADTSVARQPAPGLVGAMGNMVFITNVNGDEAIAAQDALSTWAPGHWAAPSSAPTWPTCRWCCASPCPSPKAMS
jgi:hypothetical protein